MSAGATLVAAGLAGATSSTILYPLEVVRSRITCDSAAAYSGVADAFRKVCSCRVPHPYFSSLGCRCLSDAMGVCGNCGELDRIGCACCCVCSVWVLRGEGGG